MSVWHVTQRGREFYWNGIEIFQGSDPDPSKARAEFLKYVQASSLQVDLA